MNNLWRRLAMVLAVAFVVTAMTVDFFDRVITHDDEETASNEQQVQQYQTELKRQRKLAYPLAEDEL